MRIATTILTKLDLQVAKTAAQLLLQVDPGEQGLILYQDGEGGQPLVFEFDLGNTMGLAMNRSFATLHPNGLRWFCWLFGDSNSTNSEAVFYTCKPSSRVHLCRFLGLTFGEVQQQPCNKRFVLYIERLLEKQR